MFAWGQPTAQGQGGNTGSGSTHSSQSPPSEPRPEGSGPTRSSQNVQRRGPEGAPAACCDGEVTVTLLAERIAARYYGRREILPTIERYIRTIAAAQVIPAPRAHIRTVWPGWMRPSRTASSRAIGIEAAEVLPYSARFSTNLVRE